MAKIIKVTQHDGKTIYMNVDSIEQFYESNGFTEIVFKAVVDKEQTWATVKETPEEVFEMINDFESEKISLDDCEENRTEVHGFPPKPHYWNDEVSNQNDDFKSTIMNLADKSVHKIQANLEIAKEDTSNDGVKAKDNVKRDLELNFSMGLILTAVGLIWLILLNAETMVKWLLNI